MSVLRLMNDEWVHEWMEGERKGGVDERMEDNQTRCLHGKMESN